MGAPGREEGKGAQAQAAPASASAPSDLAALRAEVGRIRWWHRLDLGRGIVTPGPLDPRPKLSRLALPADLSGRSVLDVGAWDGFFSFEAERRGARRVLATDSYCWGGGGASKEGFELARRALRSRVEDLDVDVLELSPERVGTFDLVLFLGVLYHMRHPLLALERVASVTGERLILQTRTDLGWLRRPAAAFYPDRELGGDATNWWGPNTAAVVAMLRVVGFRRIEVVYDTLRRGGPVARRLRVLRHRLRARGRPRHSDLVVHAWR